MIQLNHGGRRVLGDLFCVRMTELKTRQLDKPPPSFTWLQTCMSALGVLFLPGEDSDTELLYSPLKELKRMQHGAVSDNMPKDRSIIRILNMF